MENSEPQTPFLVVVAGPNGSGKTTITDNLRAKGFDLGEYINPDEITQDLLKNIPSPSSHETLTANKKAQTIADERRQAALIEGRSLSFETVMSHPSKVDFMRRAKERGYDVSLFFVGTDDPLINVERIKNRVQEGGHDVPPQKTISRYERVMNLMPEAVKTSDYAEIYDNSDADVPMRLTAAIEQGKTVIFLDDPPHWVNGYLLDALKSEHLKLEGPFRKKAMDFQNLTTSDLLDKYPGDKSILDAVAVRETARLFASRYLQHDIDKDRFKLLVNTRVAYNLEYGRINHTPLVHDQQNQSLQDENQ